MSLAAVPAGQLATVVTYLETTQVATGLVPASPLILQPWPRPDPARYRALFRKVGAPWLWFSRLVMADEELAAIIRDPAVSVYAVMHKLDEVGLLEIDHRMPGTVALAYVGLVPVWTGHGHGRWLLARALTEAWTPATKRVTVHTCTLDHPAALPTYRRAGFRVTGRSIETFPDPRLSGVLDLADAPQVAVLGAPATNRR